MNETAPKKRSRETIDEKGRRLVSEGRLTVKRVSFGLAEKAPIVAYCEGDSAATYSLGYDATERQWRCNCPARKRCAHLAALQLVTRLPEGGKA